MTGQIVVGVDGTKGSRRALAWAVRHALATQARLLVAAVYYDPGHRRDRVPSARVRWARQDAECALQEDLDAVLATFSERPQIDTTVVPGEVTAHVLAELAENADLLVVGSHGHSLPASRLLGTVSTGCVNSAVCPVVVIPAEHPARHHARAHTPIVSINPIPFY